MLHWHEDSLWRGQAKQTSEHMDNVEYTTILWLSTGRQAGRQARVHRWGHTYRSCIFGVDGFTLVRVEHAEVLVGADACARPYVTGL
jgi:hypothetical protein